MNLLVDLVFWLLLAAALFAGCYWMTSELGQLLVRVAPAVAASSSHLVLASSSVLTSLALAGISHLLTRK